MGPLDAIKTGFAKSFQFSGRASRAEFWWFAGAIVSCILLIGWLFGFMGNSFYSIRLKSFVFLALACLLVPAAIRRFRDAQPPESIWSFLRPVGAGSWLAVLVALGWFAGTPTSFTQSSAEVFGAIRPFAVVLFGVSLFCFFILPMLSLLFNLARPTCKAAHRVETNPHEVPQ